MEKQTETLADALRALDAIPISDYREMADALLLFPNEQAFRQANQRLQEARQRLCDQFYADHSYNILYFKTQDPRYHSGMKHTSPLTRAVQVCLDELRETQDSYESERVKVFLRHFRDAPCVICLNWWCSGVGHYKPKPKIRGVE